LSEETLKFLWTGFYFKTTALLRIMPQIRDDSCCKLQNAPARNHDQPLSR